MIDTPPSMAREPISRGNAIKPIGGSYILRLLSLVFGIMALACIGWSYRHAFWQPNRFDSDIGDWYLLAALPVIFILSLTASDSVHYVCRWFGCLTLGAGP
jgi:hypothetical protein